MSKSFTSIPATEVIALCEKTLNGVYDYRAEKIADSYDAWASDWLFGPRVIGLFKKSYYPKLTDAERDSIRANLWDKTKWPKWVQKWVYRDRNDFIPEVELILNYTSGRQESVALKLKKIATAALAANGDGATVNVNADDYSRIS